MAGMPEKDNIISQSNKQAMISIIDSYEKLPIGLYLQLCDAEDRSTEDLDIAVSRIAILTGLTEKEVLNLDLNTFQSLNQKASFVQKDAPITKIKDQYIAGEYTLIPCKDIRKMTTGQYIDYQAFCKDAGKYIIEILSCFLVPKGMKYNDGYDIEDVKNRIREDLTVTDVNALSGFFLHSLIASIEASLSCSERAARRMKDSPKKTELLRQISEQRALLKNGDGFDSLTWSRRLSEIAGKECLK